MRRITMLVAILTITVLVGSSSTITLLEGELPTWEVYFSPKGGCTKAVIGFFVEKGVFGKEEFLEMVKVVNLEIGKMV
jgi:hypothetical protein